MVNRVGKIRRYFDNISSYTIGRVSCDSGASIFGIFRIFGIFGS